MGGMRAAFVLATILALSLPQVSWSVSDVSSSGSGSMSMASSATIVTQIVRAVAKADKTFSVGSAIPHSAPSLLLPEFSLALITGLPPEPPNVDLEGPPLAPRPPPLS
jgi:hypothetical protein